MIKARDLVKWYGPVLAVDRIRFEIPQGQIVGFLGPNGAGKSTTLRMLTGYMPPSAGSASIDGLDVVTQSEQARARIGYMPENTPLYPEMRVEEYLHYRGRLYGMARSDRRQRIDVVCDRCGLGRVRRRLIGQLSKGNRQRVGLAQALLHDPPVLILDEPTAGLDPTQITHVRQLIQDLRQRHTVLLSTHILPEVEKTADRVIIIARGRIIAQGTPAELQQNVARAAGLLLEVAAASEALGGLLGKIPGVSKVETTPATGQDGWVRAVIRGDGNLDLREPVGRVIAAQGWPIREMRWARGTLEEFFIQVTAEQDQAEAPAA